MEKPLTHGSLFAGIGGFDEGFHRAGFKTLWQVEKEPFCIAVLKTHYPDAERYYDVLKCGHERKHKLRAVDVLTAGFPCQDLSVAGKRAGLEGSRSGLFWEVVRILGELRPAWFVLENVPGLFSSGEGRDFAIVLNALDELGYGVAWRVLNSQFFGVAQRRRRVFIVGRFGKPCPAEVLFEPEGGGGDFAESEEERTLASGEIAASLGGAGRSGGYQPNAEQAAGGHLVAATLSSGVGVTGNAPGRRREDDFNIVIEQNTQCSTPNRPSLRSHGTPNYAVASPITASYAKQLDSSDRNGGPPNIVQQAIFVNCLAPVGGGPDDNDAQVGHLVSAPSHTNGVRDFAGLPEGMDSARYRALGNAVTVQVAEWIGRRIIEANAQIAGLGPTGVSQKAE